MWIAFDRNHVYVLCVNVFTRRSERLGNIFLISFPSALICFVQKAVVYKKTQK